MGWVWRMLAWLLSFVFGSSVVGDKEWGRDCPPVPLFDPFTGERVGEGGAEEELTCVGEPCDAGVPAQGIADDLEEVEWE